MHVKAVRYKGEWIAPGCDAYNLFQERKFQELDKHLKQLDADCKKLLNRYGSKTVNANSLEHGPTAWDQVDGKSSGTNN